MRLIKHCIRTQAQNKQRIKWFANDVKGLLEGLRKQMENSAENKGDLQAVFTDDPIDLLLCGTDVTAAAKR